MAGSHICRKRRKQQNGRHMAPARPFCYNVATYPRLIVKGDIMGKFTHTLPVMAALAATLGAIGFSAQAATQAKGGDNLLLHRVQQEQAMNLPGRGMSMGQVERRYGAPVRKLDARGGDSKAHPVINRWEYSNFIVYFEHQHVIHSVLNTPAGNNLHPGSAG